MISMFSGKLSSVLQGDLDAATIGVPDANISSRNRH